MPTVGLELTSAQTYTDQNSVSYVIHRLLNDDNGDCVFAFCNTTVGESTGLLPATEDGDGTDDPKHEITGFAKGCILIDQRDGAVYKNTGTNLIADFEGNTL
tara:strand:- start:137 stop:442 length:306 start_codon:yes stop_codon:yes gene_type:complete